MGNNPKYRRESGYRNYMNQRMYLPMISHGIAKFIDGTRYAVRKDGWRRLPKGMPGTPVAMDAQ